MPHRDPSWAPTSSPPPWRAGATLASRRDRCSALLDGGATGAWALAEPAPHDSLGAVQLRASCVGRRVRAPRRQVPRRSRTGRHVLPGHGPQHRGPDQFRRAERCRRTGRRTAAQPGHDQAVRPPRVRPAVRAAFVGRRPRGPRRRRGRRGGLAHRFGRDGAGGRNVRGHALGSRHHLGMGREPVLVRPPAGLLPGDQAPVRRHEAVARGELRHHGAGRGSRSTATGRIVRTWSARPSSTWDATDPNSCRTACRCTAASA